MYHNTIIYDLIKTDYNDNEIEKHIGLQLQYHSLDPITRLGAESISSDVLRQITSDLNDYDDDFCYYAKVRTVTSSNSEGKTSTIDMSKPFKKPKVKKKKPHIFGFWRP